MLGEEKQLEYVLDKRFEMRVGRFSMEGGQNIIKLIRCVILLFIIVK